VEQEGIHRQVQQRRDADRRRRGPGAGQGAPPALCRRSKDGEGQAHHHPGNHPVDGGLGQHSEDHVAARLVQPRIALVLDQDGKGDVGQAVREHPLFNARWEGAELRRYHAVNPGIAVGTDGNLYGVLSGGGTTGFGSIFKITTGGAITIMHAFSSADGNAFYPPIQATDGNFPMPPAIFEKSASLVLIGPALRGSQLIPRDGDKERRAARLSRQECPAGTTQ